MIVDDNECIWLIVKMIVEFFYFEIIIEVLNGVDVLDLF